MKLTKEQESLAAFDRHLLESPIESDQQSVHARHKLEQDLVVPMELQEAITFSKGYVLAWANRQDENAKLREVIDKYAGHKIGCPMATRLPSAMMLTPEYKPGPGTSLLKTKCTCGLNDALSKAGID